MILFNRIPFQMGTSLKGKNLLPWKANVFPLKAVHCTKAFGVHVQRMLKMSRVDTLAEILGKIFVKKRRKIGDLIYDHGLTN